MINKRFGRRQLVEISHERICTDVEVAEIGLADQKAFSRFDRAPLFNGRRLLVLRRWRSGGMRLRCLPEDKLSGTTVADPDAVGVVAPGLAEQTLGAACRLLQRDTSGGVR